MIRYPVTLAQLEAAVDAHSPTWRERARGRTEAFRQAGSYSEPPAPIWSEIKPVFMGIQHNKCAYCERQLGGVERGQIEHDIEHFRPKSGVRAWPATPEMQAELGYDFGTGSASAEGYYLLAYNLLNYAVACKICNTVLKSNYFPIAANRISGQDDPRTLAAEQPLLIYPLGDWDDNPEELFGFDGQVPLPLSEDAHSHAYQRARVIIDFFELASREELLRERTKWMYALFLAMREQAKGSAQATRYLQILLSPKSPHCNCLRCYARLFRDNHAKAEAIAELALSYLESVGDTAVYL